MIKFLHTGDLHLGLGSRRLELWKTFERIVKKSIDDKMDFLFIAGDLFEEKYFTIKDINRVKNTLSKAEDVQVIISAGNHDTLNSKSLYNLVTWPENVTIFSNKGIEKLDFPDTNTRIYGYSWDRGENQRELFNNMDQVDPNKNNILIIHGDIYNKDSKYLPLDKNQLESIGFDYIGLGHIHKPEIISETMAYSGSPEPLDFGETGDHGIIVGTIEDRETNIEFVPFSLRTFLEEEIELNQDLGYMDIIDKIKSIDKLDNRKKNLYRISLKGLVSPQVELNTDDLVTSLKDDFYHLELIDKAIIDYDLDSLQRDNQNNIIGYFIEEMRKRDLNDKKNRQALYIGLETLMEGRMDI